jgi:L-tartrate/succinate antiporter
MKSLIWKSILPLLLGITIALLPVPQGLTLTAWHYFAIFTAVILALILEPIPAAAIGFIGVFLVAVLGLAGPKPAYSIRRALSGFSNTTVWLIFGAFMFAMGYEKTGIGKRIALVLGIPLRVFALLLCYSLGIMGVISPYVTGPAPVYFESGYVNRKDFWRPGLIFGLIFLVALIVIGTPYLLAIKS